MLDGRCGSGLMTQGIVHIFKQQITTELWFADKYNQTEKKMMMQKRDPLTKGINLIDVLYDHNTASHHLLASENVVNENFIKAQYNHHLRIEMRVTQGAETECEAQ